MTKVYDFSVFDMKEHNFAFAEMSPSDIDAKKLEWDEYQKTKTAAKPVSQPLNPAEAPPAVSGESQPQPKPAAKPVFRPKIKPAGPPPAP